MWHIEWRQCSRTTIVHVNLCWIGWHPQLRTQGFSCLIQMRDKRLISHPAEARALCFRAVLFSVFIGWLVYAGKVVGMAVHLGIFGDRGTGHARLPACGCRSNNVQL